jgi:hypothetical protein
VYKDANGVYPAKYGIGQSIFFLPFDVLSTVALGALRHQVPDPERVRAAIFSISVYTIVLGVNFLLCYRLSRLLGLNQFRSLLLAIVATFGSSFWQMAKQGQEEVQLSILILACAISFVQWGSTKQQAYVVCGALCAAAGLLMRITAAPIYCGFLALFLLEGGNQSGGLQAGRVKGVLRAFALAFAVCMSIDAAYNLFRNDSVWTTGYEPEVREMSKSNWIAGLWGPLLGMDRGIILTNLWLVPFALAASMGWKSAGKQARKLACLAVFLYFSSVVICCRWPTWAGDITYGARFQVHVVPLLCVTCGAIGLGGLSREIQRHRLCDKGLIAATIALVVLQIPSIAFLDSLEWYQCVRNDSACWNATGSPTNKLGQVRLRYENFVSKLLTGHVVNLPEENAASVSVTTLQQASRWDFWPWLAVGRVSEKLIRFLKIVWSAVAALSLFAWAAAMWVSSAESKKSIDGDAS